MARTAHHAPHALLALRRGGRARARGGGARGRTPQGRRAGREERAGAGSGCHRAREDIGRRVGTGSETHSCRSTVSSLAMARAIESLVATAGAAIEKLQAHATSARALEAKARAALDALPPPANDDPPDAVKTRATLRVVCRSLHARLRETLRALEGARAAVDAALLAHHRCETETRSRATRVAAETSPLESHEGDVRARASDLARIVEEAEEDGLFAPLPRLPRLRTETANCDEKTNASIDHTREEDAAHVPRSAVTDDAVPDDADVTHLPDALFAELRRLGAGARRADPATTRRVVAALAAAERDVDARAALAHEIETRFRSPGSSSETASYSAENFAYGTTSLRAWTRVVAACPALARALRALAADADAEARGGEDDADLFGTLAHLRRLETKPRCVVFGSSTGWLVFYAALAHGARSVGYELLEGRVATARATARTVLKTGSEDVDEKEEASRAESLFAFSSADATLAPLGDGAKVVVLTSQCWDESLKTRVAERLTRGLPLGALAVDYGDRLAREPAFGEPVAVVEAPTSWNRKQKFYVFQKKEVVR